MGSSPHQFRGRLPPEIPRNFSALRRCIGRIRSLYYVRCQTTYILVSNRSCTTHLKSWLFLHTRSGQQPVPFGGQGWTRTNEAKKRLIYSQVELPLSDLPISVVKIRIGYKANLLGMFCSANKSPTRVRVVKVFCNPFAG